MYTMAIIDPFSNVRNLDNRPFRIIQNVLSAHTDTKYTMSSLILSLNFTSKQSFQTSLTLTCPLPGTGRVWWS